MDNTYMPNNNLLHKKTSGYLSRCVPQSKNCSPDEIFNSLSPIYRTTI